MTRKAQWSHAFCALFSLSPGVAMSLPSSSRSPPSRLAQQWGNLLSGVGVVCTWRGTWTLIQHTLDIRE